MTDDIFKAVMTHLNILEDNIIVLYGKRDVEENKIRNVKERAKYITYLDTLDKKVTGECTCGEHVGIDFLDEDGEVVESSMCPRDWWVHKARLAYLDGKLSEFLKTTPIEKFVTYKGEKNG